MKTKSFAVLAALSIFAVPAIASAQDETSASGAHASEPTAGSHVGATMAPIRQSGFEIGLRLGYAIPLGTASSSTDQAGNTVDSKLGDSYKGQIPIRLDAGYRINPNIYVGAYAAYGIGQVNKDSDRGKSCSQNGVDCSASFLNFGVMGAYHIMPDQAFDPWVGIGIGYEVAKTKVSSGAGALTGSSSGPTLLDLQVGADYKATPNLSVGPFLSLALGQYSSCSVESTIPGITVSDCKIDKKALHEWLTLGVKGSFGAW